MKLGITTNTTMLIVLVAAPLLPTVNGASVNVIMAIRRGLEDVQMIGPASRTGLTILIRLSTVPAAQPARRWT